MNYFPYQIPYKIHSLWPVKVSQKLSSMTVFTCCMHKPSAAGGISCRPPHRAWHSCRIRP